MKPCEHWVLEQKEISKYFSFHGLITNSALSGLIQLVQGKNSYTEEQLHKGIRNQDNQVIRYLYKQYRPAIRLLVYRMGGNWDDAKDVFQDSLIILMKMFTELDYRPRCTVKTLLYSICKYQWSKKRRSKARETHYKSSDHEEVMQPDFPEQEDIRLYEKLYWATFNFLPETCRKVLLLFWSGYSYLEMGKVLNRSEGYLRKRKSLCTGKFVEMVKSSKEYHLLTNSTIELNSKKGSND